MSVDLPTPQELSDELRARELSFALALIAHGTSDEKIRYIAKTDPDYFVDHVLDWQVDYTSRDEAAPALSPINPAVLDSVVANIALGFNQPQPLAETA